MPDREKKGDKRTGTALKERGEERVKRPRMFRVVIHNDDFTPIEFVTMLIAQVFRKSMEEAAQITMTVHLQGAATAGVYTREIAETKIHEAMAHAERLEHPLQLTMEPVDDGEEG